MSIIDDDLAGRPAARLYPFVVGYVIKLFAAAILLPGSWKLMDRYRS